MIQLRGNLLDTGVLEERAGKLHLLRDYVFNSPSTAAGVLLGGNVNGRTAWKDAQGHTLKQIQTAVAAASV